MKASPMKVAGSALMVAGCCIGAGMLGLPALSAPAGFGPSLVMFFLSWLFMATTGLLLLEVNGWFSDDAGLISLAQRTVGPWGRLLTWVGYLFLFYALMVAYISGCGALVQEALAEELHLSLPSWIVGGAVTLLFAAIIVLGTGAVDRSNRLLMGGLALSYLLLLGAGVGKVSVSNLTHYYWPAAPFVLPAMIISFGYHNLVPTLFQYLEGDRRSLVTAIVVGSGLPLAVYVLWQLLILGIVPAGAVQTLSETIQGGDMATTLLRKALGKGWVLTVAQWFAFFSIVTSFITVATSFVDFYIDGLHWHAKKWRRYGATVLALAPPYAVAMIYPHAFLLALNYAGAFGAVTLYGILPALMVWQGRYRQGRPSAAIVPGGRLTLLAVIGAAVAIMAMQLFLTV